MANYSDNDSLMIHCFQDSLMEDAAEWYTGLSKDDIHTFDDLAAAFKSHYGFNIRLKPNREFLRSLFQKKDESFREYAQRWRGAAARITPALDEEEMTQTFLKTLKKDYVERRSTFLVKAFDGSRKNVLGEVDLPMTIGVTPRFPQNDIIISKHQS